MFGRKKAPPEELEEEVFPPANPRVLEVLERLEKTGGQLTVRPDKGDAHTSAVVGLGRDSFFIDTLSPPEGDVLVKPGSRVRIETLFQGILYRFEAKVLGRVRFVDELPAFRLEYPDDIPGERRRKSPRIATNGDASLSFLQPFACDAPVVNVSEGGAAFEYGAELGRLRRGAVLKGLLLELGRLPVISIQARVVAQVVCELGGLGLPRRYRVGIVFQGLSPSELELVRTYLQATAPPSFRA